VQYAQAQRHPARHSVGFGVVVLLHVVVVYALVTGLARKVVDVIKRPIEAKVIEEIRKPPPPPEIAVPPPPKLEAPPPPFIPPPEVQIQQPVPTPSSITASRSTPPDTNTLVPTPPPAPPTVAQPGPVSAGVVCGNYATVMGDVAFPREAVRQGIEKGDALIQFTVGATGAVKDVHVVSASHPIFARNSLRIVGEYKCQAQGREVLVQVPFSYRQQ